MNESNGENTWTSVSDNKFFKKCTKLGKKKLSCFLKKNKIKKQKKIKKSLSYFLSFALFAKLYYT